MLFSSFCFHHFYFPAQLVGFTLSDVLDKPVNERWGGHVPFTVTAAGQVYKQMVDFVYLGGAISADWDLRSVGAKRRIQRAWACFGRYKMETYDRPCVRVRLKVWILKADVLETLLYGCVPWSPCKAG